MSSLFDKLNLRPQERRLVVIVGIVVFVVLNFWLVIPMFGEYGKNEQRIKDTRAKLKTYQDEIGRKSAYEKELRELETQGGFVPTEEAGLRLSQEASSQAALSGVTVTSITPLQRQATSGKTNAFFDEAAVTVNINTGEKELCDFLWRLADKETLIRAKSMQLGTDPGRTRLQGQITLVKSFQRRPPPKSALAAATSAASAATTKSNVPARPAPGGPAPGTKVAPPVAGARPPPSGVGPSPAPIPSPVPAPSPAGGTNRIRRAMPTPAKP